MGPRVFHAKFQPNRSKDVGLSHGVGLVIFKKMVPFNFLGLIYGQKVQCVRCSSLGSEEVLKH